MSVMNMIEALNSAHKVMMARDPDVVVFGEDVGYFGGVFRVTAGLQKEFGTSRVFDAPIAEGGIVAAGIGMGLYGLKPVIEIQFADYIFPGFDQIFSEAGRIRYRTAGEWAVPMVIRSPYGGGLYERPLTPWAKHPAAEVPEDYYTVPLGKAAIARAGEAVTVLAYGTMVHVALATAEAEGIDAEVIDLRTIVPVDIATIEESVKKTGRCIVLHEATRTAGFGGELSALVQERCFYHLEAPAQRVTGYDTPYPHSMEWTYFPGPARLARALKAVLED